MLHDFKFRTPEEVLAGLTGKNVAAVQAMEQKMEKRTVGGNATRASKSSMAAQAPGTGMSGMDMSGMDKVSFAAIAHSRFWPEVADGQWAERVRSAQVIQTSTCSAIASASSTSMPR